MQASPVAASFYSLTQAGQLRRAQLLLIVYAVYSCMEASNQCVRKTVVLASRVESPQCRARAQSCLQSGSRRPQFLHTQRRILSTPRRRMHLSHMRQRHVASAWCNCTSCLPASAPRVEGRTYASSIPASWKAHLMPNACYAGGRACRSDHSFKQCLKLSANLEQLQGAAEGGERGEGRFIPAAFAGWSRRWK